MVTVMARQTQTRCSKCRPNAEAVTDVCRWMGSVGLGGGKVSRDGMQVYKSTGTR